VRNSALCVESSPTRFERSRSYGSRPAAERSTATTSLAARSQSTYGSLEPTETGRPMGHEAIGLVEDVGAEVRSIKVDDLVVMPFAFSDGTCVLQRGAA
jgi:hypothetical protein